MNLKAIIKPYYHKYRNFLKIKNRIGLKNRNVSIISNNCGGGFISQHFGLPYNSPTAGLFFHSEDYVKFVKNLNHYFQQELVFINPEVSKYFDEYKPISYPVARCDDIEVFFMHYPTIEEARKKWFRRIERVDFENIYIIFLENETTTAKQLEEFDKITAPHMSLVFSDYKNLKYSVKNIDVLNHKFHHWLPEYVINSCDWKQVFNNMRR